MTTFIYCPRCAHELTRQHVYGRERAVCPACGFIHFREPKLAVGGLVTQEGRVLLIRRAVIPRIGFWAVPSGFVEYDEEPRLALMREIEEETGLRVEVGQVIQVYANADPTKPGVFLLFAAHSADGILAPGDDVTEARWFGPDDLPWEELAFAQTSEVLRAYWGL